MPALCRDPVARPGRGNRILLEHGKPVRFGPNGERGVVADSNGTLRIVDVEEQLRENEQLSALGLLAAIPATIAYNKLSTDVAKLTSRMEGFSDEFSAILSRQIDERVGQPQRAAA